MAIPATKVLPEVPVGSDGRIRVPQATYDPAPMKSPLSVRPATVSFGLHRYRWTTPADRLQKPV